MSVVASDSSCPGSEFLRCSKELDCLHAVAELLEGRRHQGLDIILQQLVELLPAAFCRADAVIVRLDCAGKIYESAGFSPTPWNIGADVLVGGQIEGRLEVAYREQQACCFGDSCFYPEEQRLLDTVAMLVGTVLERGRNEAQVQRLARLYAMLSRCNEALIHAGEERTLLWEMCRLIVEMGGYELAWVGYADPQPECQVRPVASFGKAEWVLKQAHITWGEGESGQGPVGRAIRSGEIQVVQDIATEPGWTLWNERGMRDEFRGSIVLPLRQFGKVFGVLVIDSAAPDAFDATETNMLAELAGNLAFGVSNLRTSVAGALAHSRLEHSLESTIQAMSLSLEKRDPYTAGHQRRVAELCTAIGRKLGLGEEQLKGLHLGASIHDIGKIYVPAEILNRPGRLTPVEMELIKTHSQVGYDIIRGIEFPWPLADMIHQHHERLDGSGYPQGLKGTEIVLEARILAVADVVEAVASHRPYRPARGIGVALDEVAASRGIHYDERVVDACLSLFLEDGFTLT